MLWNGYLFCKITCFTELFYDRGDHFEFTSVSRELAPAGTLTEPEVEFPFDFADIEKPYESYNGINVRLRFVLNCRIGFL